jgi:hypothetical protein
MTFPQQFLDIVIDNKYGPKSIIIKVTASGGTPEGGAISEYTKPQVTIAQFEFSSELLLGNITRRASSNSQENSKFRFNCVITTKFDEMNNSPNAQPGQCLYVSDAQKAIVAEVNETKRSRNQSTRAHYSVGSNRSLVLHSHPVPL